MTFDERHSNVSAPSGNSLFMKKLEKKDNLSVSINISQLAREVGVNRSHVSLILNKERMPSLPVAGRLAKAMGITLDELHDRLIAAAA